MNLFKFTSLIITSVILITMATPINSIADENSEEAKKLEEEIEKQREKLEEKESKLSEIKAKADIISKSIGNISGKLNVTKSQINSLQNDIKLIEEDIADLSVKMQIKSNEIDEQKRLRNLTLKKLYITNQKGLFEILFTQDDLISGIQNSAYYKLFINDSKNMVGQINKQIQVYENDKKEIEAVKAQVEGQKKELQKIADNLARQAASAQNELAAVSQQQLALQQEKNSIQKTLNELSDKQRSILGEKTETFSTSVGDVPSTGDPNSRADYDPGFRKAFALFSFGAPHRKGMSQYGAKGRAEAGQGYKDILKAYYGNIGISKPDLPDNINTDKGSLELDGKYLYGLAEMPANWPMEALKAQAVAARTYAMSYIGWRSGNTDPGGKICTTESCQVWSASKASAESAERWRKAVDETKGQIMLGSDTDEVFSAWYAASSGGYNYKYTSLDHTTKGGWDTKCGSKDCWTSEAYESKAGSPWFYKGWYKTRSGETCGRKHPWLTEKEFADIIGAMVLYEDNKNNQKHLSQPDAKTCWGEDIDDTWSRDEVKEKSGVESVSDVDVTYSGDGITAEVKVKTNKGEYKFDGEDFKAVFNLRAPGAIHLTSLLYNIEMKK